MRNKNEIVIRTFIAIELNKEQKENVNKIITDISQINADTAFTEPENLHVTIKFIGNINEKSLDDLKQECKLALKDQEQFLLNLNGVGVFESWDYLKVLWIGIRKGNTAIEEMHKKLSETLTLGEKNKRKLRGIGIILRQ